MRCISSFLLIHFIAVTIAPAWIVGTFLLERTRIEKELCVQRMVADGQRTCHGECQLKKRLTQSGKEERSLPAVLLTVRLGDFILEEELGLLFLPSHSELQYWNRYAESPLEGHAWLVAPVPWC